MGFRQEIGETDLLSLQRPEMIDFCKALGLPGFRGKQLWQWIYQKAQLDYEQMTNLPQKAVELLKNHSVLVLPKIIKEQVSKDQSTAKLLLQFADEVLIEIVIMLYDRGESRNRQTVCISTQAGCGMGCRFCATALGGLERNLTAGEIVAQVLVAEVWCKNRGLDGVSNVVYMGMGEPLANLPAVLQSIKIVNDEEGLKIGQRRLTISTCGLVPQIKEFADAKLAVGLAISLHGSTDDVRSKLMPVNQNYPLASLLAACDYFTAQTGRRVSYEYALLKGVNDSQELAHLLGKLLKGKLSHINLIPVNYVPETGFFPSDPETIKEFAATLVRYNIETTVREKKGVEIDAACGQLRNKNREFKVEA